MTTTTTTIPNPLCSYDVMSCHQIAKMRAAAKKLAHQSSSSTASEASTTVMNYDTPEGVIGDGDDTLGSTNFSRSGSIESSYDDGVVAGPFITTGGLDINDAPATTTTMMTASPITTTRMATMTDHDDAVMNVAAAIPPTIGVSVPTTSSPFGPSLPSTTSSSSSSSSSSWSWTSWWNGIFGASTTTTTPAPSTTITTCRDDLMALINPLTRWLSGFFTTTTTPL